MKAPEIVAACEALIARGTKPTRPDVSPLIEAFYKLPGNGAGGDLHVVLDDHNVERQHVRYCVETATDPVAIALGRVLLLLSNSQRRKI